jgi:hypothetical protein
LAAEEHRDADTWGVHLLDAAQQGLNPIGTKIASHAGN